MTWQIRIALADLVEPLGGAPVTKAEAVGPRARDVIAYVQPHLRVGTAGTPCPSVRAGFLPEPDADAVRMRLAFACPDGAADLHAAYDLFFDLDPLHTGLVVARYAGVPVASGVFRTDLRRLDIARPPSSGTQAGRFFRLGIEHILTGYDHLAFVLALLLGVLGTRGGPAEKGAPNHSVMPAERRSSALREALVLISAFTVAHSVTLAAAVLRPGLAPAGLVEPLIALSVGWVGLENLIGRRLFARRWPLVFAFGLVHGVGFAGALGETGFPRDALFVSLAGFNLGVEVGQVGVILLLFPALAWLLRARPRVFQRFVFRPGSAAITVAGLVWFLARVWPAA